MKARTPRQTRNSQTKAAKTFNVFQDSLKNIRSLKDHEHYILAKEAVRANKIDIFTVRDGPLEK